MSPRIIPAAAAVLLLPLFTSPLAGQRWSVGALAGANRSTAVGSDAEGFTSRIGAVGGAQLVRTLGGNLALEVDGLFSIKGARKAGQGITADVTLNYVEVPLLLRIGRSTGGTVRPFATAGASAGFRLSCTATERGMGLSGSASCDEVADFRRFDATLIGGAGLDAALGSGTMTLAVRYGYGLQTIVTDADVKNRALTLLTGWRVPLGRK